MQIAFAYHTAGEDMENNGISVDEGQPTLVEMAINLAIKSVIEGGLGWQVLEEATTGALLGGISSSIQWINEISPVEQGDKVHWTLYRKSGSDLSSESWTGSDFSLLLRVSEDNFRVATFQAKRPTNAANGFKAIQISPAAGDIRPEPQIIRMIRHSNNYNTLSANSISTAHWVHFLVYGKLDMLHHPLSGMRSFCERAYLFDLKVKGKENKHMESSGGLYGKRKIEKIWKRFPTEFVYTPKKSARFSDLIKHGTRTPADKDAEGWRSIKGREAATAFIDATVPHCPTLLVSSKSSYTPVVSHSKSIEASSIGTTVKDVFASVEALKDKLANKGIASSRTNTMGKG
ncbi:hypothetical protein [Xanthomonas phaseoli]|uniref:hypothetical protein n=1 Tax=Xanthomonas phaseoli TaxID=1985254 RepID=UPI00035DBE83|nr:hypothetical protein [Xanthomonas phaseoli]MBO9755399.1 hypothetical protein [Xanthomonas phaseoli pv. manihotis]MBO9763788.1 hypothetical protein [Xanthomonas phaseoli pv. manihotis]